MAYVYQEFPKVKYHATKNPATVDNAEEERELGEGWENTPAAFPNYNRKTSDPVPNTVEEVNAELEHWYVQLSKDPDCPKGTPWRDSIETRIEQLKFRKELLLEKPSSKEERVPILSQLPDRESLQSDLSSFAEDIRPTSVIFVDLDNFKEVNDSLGHQEGDECLERVVELIGSAVIKKGTLYRYGGDEFIVVLPNFESGEAAPTGERIRKSIDERNPGDNVKVTASIGIVSSNQMEALDSKELLEAADQAMYFSKNSGRNRVTVWEPSLKLARGQELSLLSRTYFEGSLKSESEDDFNKARKTWEEAEDILRQYPGTKELAELFILDGDILKAGNFADAEDSYKRAKAEIPVDLQTKSEVFARACKQLGRFYAANKQTTQARIELNMAAKIYDHLQNAHNADSCRLILCRLDAEEKGALTLFQQFARVAKNQESNPEIRLLAWQEHLHKSTRRGVVAKRSDSKPPDSYWIDLIKDGRKQWEKRPRPL